MFALLDQSKARVQMLIAPAGYGKTTLAEQWTERDGRRGIWFTARSSSTDVAALALGIAQSAKVIAPECDVRLRAHLKALPAPAESVETLAEILGGDLADWPADAWLVLDDYHEVAEEPRAEDFVKTLVAVAPLNVVIASRIRPAWITTKELLYGEAFEVNQTTLAMDAIEAADVLVDRSPPSASSLVLLANGWPAVIGLAGVSSAEIADDIEQVPESLYRFFADEVFGALGIDVQQGLTTLAVAPVLDRELAVALLGADDAETVCAAALDVGLLMERGQQLELHPLARVFLEERSVQLGLEPAADAADVCLTTYRGRRDWDAAFELIAKRRARDDLDDLMARALDELLDTARLSTLERWCDLATDIGVVAPIFALARAEVMLRRGRHLEAVSHAEAAAAADSMLEFRALTVAGRAAHLASREAEALALYQRAEAAATSDPEIRDARWSQLMCLIELESPEAERALRELESGVRTIDTRDVVRAAAWGLSFQVKLGNIDLYDADLASSLLGQVSDPLVTSAFLSTYAAVLGLACRYDDAVEVVDAFNATIEQYRFDFARPYALLAASLAYAGLRQWGRSRAHVSDAFAIAKRARDGHVQQLCLAQWIRILIQQGRPYEALDLEPPVVRDPLPAAEAELTGSRALALAVCGRTQEARRLVDRARGVSRAVEPAVLIAAVDAICALTDHDRDSIDRVVALERVAFHRGALDIIVTAWRASPELLRVLLRASEEPERVSRLVRLVQDTDLAQLVGYQVPATGDRRKTLTRRERDVYDLLLQDFKNREIARLLFIEESTVKAHSHRIYDKLGVRSRRGLIVQALLERSDQATSATDSSAADAS